MTDVKDDATDADDAQLVERYTAEIVRLQALIEQVDRDRKKVRVFLWGLLLAPFGAFVHILVVAGIALIALSLYFCGLCLSSMHYWDRTDQLKHLRRSLAKLRPAREGDAT